MATGKKFKAAAAKVDRVRRYKVDEAMKLVKETAVRKFDEDRKSTRLNSSH